MINEIKADARSRMEKSVESLGYAFAKIRTGRAHPSILDAVRVDYYGSEVPVGQVANISVEDARTLAVTPWEKPMVGDIEKSNHEVRSWTESCVSRRRDSCSDAAFDRRNAEGLSPSRHAPKLSKQKLLCVTSVVMR